MFWLISISSVIIFSYIPIHLAVEQSRQDSWISLLLGGAIVMAITWLMLRVCKQNSDKTLVGFMKDLLGSVLGNIVVTAYFLLWFIQMSMILSGMVAFQNLVMLHNTPMVVILLFIVFLVTYGVYRGGATAISRCGEMIGPIFIFVLFLQLFLNPQDMNVNRILPVYTDTGWVQILKGTVNSLNYMADPSIILMLFYFAENKRTASRAILWGTAVALLWGVLATLALLFIVGPMIAAQLVFPVYSLTKYISILDFIQNIDAFFIPLWLLGAFIKLSVLLFILSYGISEWTGIKNWKMIACLISFLWMAYVIYSSNHIEFANALKTKSLIGYYYPAVYIVIPLILLAIGSVRQRRVTQGFDP